MKKNIHPTYHTSAKVVCVCGNSFEVGSTKEELRVELCSQCHPFYTGKQKLVDTSKRVEKFESKRKAQKELSQIKKGKTAKRAAKEEKRKAKEEDADQ